MTVLVIAPHPDDETLGCAGTLLCHRAEVAAIAWLTVTNMERDVYGEARFRERQQEIKEVREAYGFSYARNLGLPTTRLDTLP